MKRVLSLILVSLVFTGCGGSSGSGGSSSQPPGGENSAPVANAGSDSSTTLGQEVTLSGAASSDADGDSLSYSWEIAAAPSDSNPYFSASTQVETAFSADVAGTYEIELSVSDGTASAVDTVIVTVTGEAGLSANAGSGYSTPEGQNIALDGSGSVAPSGDTLSFSWTIISTPPTSTATLQNPGSVSPVLLEPSVGNYEIQLEVRNESGESSIDTTSVLVHDYLPIIDPPEHYTAITPAPDTKIVYVSESLGDDANDGMSSNSPVKSIERGKSLLRDGFPDWLALKAGDVWETGLGGWSKSGQSESAPMVITSYGQGTDRPVLKTLDRDALRFQGGGGSPEYVDYLAIYGIHFYAASRDPNAPEFDPEISSNRGIVWLRGTRGLLIEDNRFDFYKDAITLQEVDGFDIRNVLIKNNVILDSYHLAGGSHAQGIYLSETDTVRIERNVFDHIGWNETVAGADRTKFNHSIYVQSDNRDIEIVDNIMARSSSHGVQLRSGGLMEGNVAIRNAIGLMLGGNSGQGDPGIIRNNVVLQGRDISSEDLLGWGIDLTSGIVSATVENNIVAHEASEASNPMAIRESSLSTQSNNAIYNWGDQSQPASAFADPTRTILSFDAQAGGDGTMESFIANIRSKSMRATNDAYDVENIRAYFKDGFAPAQ
ncbi:PKD domain-containing protein [Microbulbifer hydrolyticus]|uniref:PKD domain-containing protein n=1 Tax=Microbulbifer hydrolyticus TaxID=48074 RepID=A0A6P1TG04_9GAMM|nr:right-handed parallel beta-helix repeat-containing protein [Microbulbifer hydrolyticus]MBB5211847.1 hypothetical protein [Microbulbifer hydrolyticus]QHQ40565.1 hypothetical protein GTQ55_17325 [Microbulbifer hydrolyticus]